MEIESLYSLEIYVKEIQDLSLPCGIPAIAFRFLDYPSVLIYLTDLEMVDRLKKKVKDIRNVNQSELADLQELRNASNGYDFGRGKSCLFRKTCTNLKNLLTEVPLYITLVDCLSNQPKLLGICSIPLLSLIQTIENIQSQLFEEDSPAVSVENFCVSLCNLMGMKIGVLNINVKLTCFGSSLLRHVTVEEKRDSQINILLQNLSMENPTKLNVADEKEKVDHIIIPADGKKESSKRNPVVKMKNKGLQVSMKTSKKSIQQRIHKDTLICSSDTDVVDNDNTVRPPPLFLNLHRNENIVISRQFTDTICRQKSKYLLETKFDEFDDDRISSDEEAFVETLVPIQSRSERYQIISQQNNDEIKEKNSRKEINESENVKGDVNNLISHASTMPVLCSLLKEISQLNDLVNGPKNDNGKLSPKPPKVMLKDKQKRLNYDEEISSVVPHLLSHLRMDRTNESILLEYGNKKSKSHSKTNSKQNPQQEEEKGERKQHKHKRTLKNKKLSYGLTRTQRLRYAMTHEGEDPLVGDDLENENVSAVAATNVKSKGDVISGEMNGSSHIHSSVGLDLYKEILVDEEQEERKTITDIVHVPTTSVDFDIGGGEIVSNEENSQPVSLSDEEINVRDRMTESKVGFYSPSEPRQITWSELGDFNDTHPWNSVEESRDKSLQPRDYSDESFVSDNNSGEHSTISGTSSISLPRVSQVSNDSSAQIPHDDSRNHSTPIPSQKSPQRSRSNSRLVSYTPKPINSRSSVKDSFRSSSIVSNNNNDRTHSSLSDDGAIHTSSRASSNNSTTDIPKQSAYSPIKSNYKKQLSEDNNENYLNITLPSANSQSQIVSSNNSEL